MGGVYISPNLKKTTVRIDTEGNIIDKNTRQIIESNKPEFVPTPEDIQKTIQSADNEVVTEKDSMSEKINKMVEAKLASKIDEIVDKKVSEILSRL